MEGSSHRYSVAEVGRQTRMLDTALSVLDGIRGRGEYTTGLRRGAPCVTERDIAHGVG